jgi:uncharacterized protein (TIGR02266 family)
VEHDRARRAPRHTVNHEFASIDEFIAEYVTNISRTGVFIRSRQPLPVGTKVNLRFTVILDDPETIEGIGEVVRVSDDPQGMGVVFVNLTSVSQAIVERLVVRGTPASGPRRVPTLPGTGRRK